MTVPLQEKGSALLNEIRKHCPEGSLNLVVAGRHLDLDKTLEAQEIKEGQKVVVTKQTRDEETPDPNVIKRPHHSQLKVDPKFDGLNAGSVDALQQLGIADNKIIDVLRQLRNKPNYTSLGEVEKALDILEAEQK